ncbi:solute carrier family 2, facilitated glucose transporter member 5-like [Erythrolamprus reginae]|uniref:solute carrier family 2, facilitated glucose transporter member 5-like n=1 Tax=Erythrolamprus reginae TaxID=121349 RepID=UPI00396CC890
MEELKTAWKGVSRHFLSTALTCYVICMHCGFYGWILYSPEVLIHFFYNVSEPNQLPDPAAQLFFMHIVLDLFPLGASVGSLLSGYMADRFGRKGSMVATNLLTIISATFLSSNTIISAYEFTICAHLLAGICLGATLCLIYLYLFEIAPRPIRGGVLMLTNFFIKLGNMISQIVTFFAITGHWRGLYLMIFLSTIISLTLIFILPRIPESPRYLLIQKDDEETARNVLQWLTLSGDVEEEVKELQEEKLAEMGEKKKDLNNSNRISIDSWSIFSIIVIIGGTQLAGFHTLYYYNYTILRDILKNYISTWALKMTISILLCFIALIGTCLVDYLGRRILFMTGLAVCTVTLILIVAVLEMIRHKKTSLIADGFLTYVCVILIVMFLVGYTIGPNIVSLIFTLELFLQSSRASGLSIAGFIFYLANIMLKMLKSKLKNELGSFDLLLFTPFCVGVLVYVYVYIPETKNQTLKDIRTRIMRRKIRNLRVKKQKRRNSVYPLN